MPKKLTVVFLIILFSITQLTAQPVSAGPSAKRYPFIRHDLNFIDNNYKGLKNFYSQLNLLEQGKKKKINIVHIGDSHLQADWFSGIVRMELQRKFGSAGRGLVFPFRVAQTNSPDDIFSYSNIKWSVGKNIQSRPPAPVGISGFGIRTYSSNFILKLSIGENLYGIDYGFDRVSFITEKGPQAFDLLISSRSRPISKAIVQNRSPDKAQYHLVQKGENLTSIAARYNMSVQQLMELNEMKKSTIYFGKKLLVKVGSSSSSTPQKPTNSSQKDEIPVFLSTQDNSYISTVDLNQPISEMYIKGQKQGNNQSQFALYGMILENALQPGILYHMIGVNGAKFEHYNAMPKFLDQLQELEPDLIILSLGTNETAYQIFNSASFFSHLDEFVYDMEQYMPYTDILITTPPDALLKRSYDNKNVKKAKDILLSYSLNNDLACWNFYDVMGGLGSVREWYVSGLAQADRLHLTQTGYELQGKLLFEALMNGYGSYQSVKSR